MDAVNGLLPVFGVFMSSAPVMRRLRHAGHWIDRAAGACVVAIGLRIPADARTTVSPERTRLSRRPWIDQNKATALEPANVARGDGRAGGRGGRGDQGVKGLDGLARLSAQNDNLAVAPGGRTAEGHNAMVSRTIIG